MIKLTEKHLNYMNMGRRFWDADIGKANPDQRKVISNYVRNFEQMLKEGVGLYICGPNGTGKTYIASALMKYAWSSWKVTSYMTTSFDLKEAFINDFEASVGSEETVLYRARNARLFVIDDIGREYRAKSGFSESNFSALVRHRSRNLQTTIITTNVTPKEFKEVYGESFTQIVKEATIPILLRGEDMREKIQQDLVRRVGG